MALSLYAVLFLLSVGNNLQPVDGIVVHNNPPRSVLTLKDIIIKNHKTVPLREVQACTIYDKKRTLFEEQCSKGMKMFQYTLIETNSLDKSGYTFTLLSKQKIDSIIDLFSLIPDENNIIYYEKSSIRSGQCARLTVYSGAGRFGLDTPLDNIASEEICLRWHWTRFDGPSGRIISDDYLFTICLR